jgi:hypothetical protein
MSVAWRGVACGTVGALTTIWYFRSRSRSVVLKAVDLGTWIAEQLVCEWGSTERRKEKGERVHLFHGRKMPFVN